MDEAEDLLAESVFGGREPNAPTSTDENGDFSSNLKNFLISFSVTKISLQRVLCAFTGLLYRIKLWRLHSYIHMGVYCLII